VHYPRPSPRQPSAAVRVLLRSHDGAWYRSCRRASRHPRELDRTARTSVESSTARARAGAARTPARTVLRAGAVAYSHAGARRILAPACAGTTVTSTTPQRAASNPPRTLCMPSHVFQHRPGEGVRVLAARPDHLGERQRLAQAGPHLLHEPEEILFLPGLSLPMRLRDVHDQPGLEYTSS
jgi:hypothetical protein